MTRLISNSLFQTATQYTEKNFENQIDGLAPKLRKLSPDSRIERLTKDLYLPEVKTNEAQKFYADFDGFTHPETGQTVEKLAEHQVECWNDQFKYIYRMYVKAQKILLTSIFLLEDIFHGLTDAQGMEILLIGQSLNHATIHLQDLRKMILASKYRDYLITKPFPEIGLLKDEVTKVGTAYLHNPKNFLRPTKIYALGPTPGSLLSYKRVKHVHASDISKSKETPDTLKETVASLISRLANTAGSFVLEGPPRGLSGPVWEEYQKFEDMQKRGIDLSKISRNEQRKYPFFVRKYTYEAGIRAGVITPEFIEGERNRWGPLFGMLYMADFYESDQNWYKPEMFATSKEATDFFAGVGI
jgi:hypothetical protein